MPKVRDCLRQWILMGQDIARIYLKELGSQDVDWINLTEDREFLERVSTCWVLRKYPDP
jgi:hypothetical protein